jgi:hypothetical protein
MDRGNAAESARHSESGGTDAGRQRVIARDARIWRTWNFAALGRGNPPGDLMGSLIKELLRLVHSKMAPAEGRQYRTQESPPVINAPSLRVAHRPIVL